MLDGIPRISFSGWEAEALADEIERFCIPRPRYEDGEPVQMGDRYLMANGSHDTVSSLSYSKGSVDYVSINGRRRMLSERVKRPAPEALLADGEPARRGERVWRTTTGHEGTVDGTEDGMVLVRWVDTSLIDCPVDPAWLTSTPPVLAADGKPLREGDAVWLTDEGAAHAGQSFVKSDGACGLRGIGPDERLVVENACLMPNGREHVNLGKYGAWCPASWLTHEEPVTQDQIDEWVTMPMREYYAERIGHNVGLLDDAEVYEAVVRDLLASQCAVLARGGE